jgi:hypothetical protein
MVNRVVGGIPTEAEVSPLTRRNAFFAGTVGSLLTHGYREGGATRRGSYLEAS